MNLAEKSSARRVMSEAIAKYHSGQTNEAIKKFKTLMKMVNGPAIADLTRQAVTACWLAECFAQQGKIEAAEAQFTEALRTLQFRFGDRHYELHIPLIGLGYFYLKQGRNKEAEETFEKVSSTHSDEREVAAPSPRRGWAWSVIEPAGSARRRSISGGQ
jgi:tetratricopeptide (TPR) repeat protein